MKNKRIILFLVIIIMISLYCLRVNQLCKKEYIYHIQYYNHGEEVSLDNDFFDIKQDAPNGYSIKVLKTELISREDFMYKYNISEEAIPRFYENVYLVTAKFHNYNEILNENTGVNLTYYVLQDDEYMTYAYREVIPAINNINTFAFSLIPNSDAELIIPFFINPEYVSIQRLKNGNPTLIASLYPNKKAIYLN